MPVLEKVLDAMAPGDAPRYQHSDSAMGQLLEDQYALGIREVNFGPEVAVALIREKMPDAMIHGHVPPFLLLNGAPEKIKTCILDNFRDAGQTGGLEITTAGSLGCRDTGVGRMRWMMQVVQKHCRYEGATPMPRDQVDSHLLDLDSPNVFLCHDCLDRSITEDMIAFF